MQVLFLRILDFPYVFATVSLPESLLHVIDTVESFVSLNANNPLFYKLVANSDIVSILIFLLIIYINKNV